jgi:hypothetical protein
MSVAELDEFLSLVESRPDEAHFTGPRPEQLVVQAEKFLGIKFPSTYRKFTKSLGAGSFAGEEFYGVVDGNFQDSSIPDGIWLTDSARDEWDLPSAMIVVYFDGGASYGVLDTARGEDPPVEAWVPGGSRPGELLERLGADFGSFLLDLARESLDLT